MKKETWRNKRYKGERVLGATGHFPEGKLRGDDEGELSFAVGHDKEGNVIIDFGTPVLWFAMDHEAAVELAGTIMKHAAEAYTELNK